MRQVVEMGKAQASWAVDDLGPAMVAFLRPCRGVEAVVVVDNVALGPGDRRRLTHVPPSADGGGRGLRAGPSPWPGLPLPVTIASDLGAATEGP